MQRLIMTSIYNEEDKFIAMETERSRGKSTEKIGDRFFRF